MSALNQNVAFYLAHNRMARTKRHIEAAEDLLIDLKKDMQEAAAERQYHCNHDESRYFRDFNDPLQKEVKECVLCGKNLDDNEVSCK